MGRSGVERCFGPHTFMNILCNKRMRKVPSTQSLACHSLEAAHINDYVKKSKAPGRVLSQRGHVARSRQQGRSADMVGDIDSIGDWSRKTYPLCTVVLLECHVEYVLAKLHAWMWLHRAPHPLQSLAQVRLIWHTEIKIAAKNICEQSECNSDPRPCPLSCCARHGRR
jgi:hypothetical protein